MDHTNGDKYRLLVMICLTMSLFLANFIVSCITNSMVHTANWFHILDSIKALVVSFTTLSITSNKWSTNTFRWAEILGSLINTTILLTSSFSIIFEALKLLILLEPIRPPKLTYHVNVLGLIVNIIGLFLFRDHGGNHGHCNPHRGKLRRNKIFIKSEIVAGDNVTVIEKNNQLFPNNHFHNGRSAGQMNMRGVYLCFLIDTLGSATGILSTLIMWLTEWEYHYNIHLVLIILMRMIILRSAWPLFRESALILLQIAPTHIHLDDIQRRILEIEGVLAMHEFHAWRLTGDEIIASAHIKYTNFREHAELAKKVKIVFNNEGIHSTTIQLEFVKFEDQNNIRTEDCELNSLNTNTSFQLQKSSRSKNEKHEIMSTVDTLHLCKKRKTSSGTANTTDHPRTDLTVDENSGKNIQLITMICLTTCLFLVEAIVGCSTRSIALIENSFHMLTNNVALMVSYVALNMAFKKSSNNTFGWARIEVLGSLVNALFLVALCFTVTLESLKKFIEIEPTTEPLLVVVVGVLGMIINIMGLFFFQGHGGSHGHSHGGKSHSHKPLIKLERGREKDNAINYNETMYDFYVPHNHSRNGHSAGKINMRGIYLHFLADAIGSVIVIISALIVWLTEWEYRNYVYPALSIIKVIIILRSAGPLLRESILILLQTAPDHIRVDDVQTRLMEINGILGVHEFHVWQLTGDIIIASAHIRCSNLLDYIMILEERVKIFFRDEGIHCTTIQPEFVKIETPNKDCVLDCPKTNLQCQLKTCCGSIKQDYVTTSPVDTPNLCRKRKTSSAIIHCSETDLTVKQNNSKKSGIVVMIYLIACFFLVEIIVGYTTNSMSLVADSFHMLSDILALIVSYTALIMASKKWPKNTFGWARAEVIGSLINALFLTALCFTIAFEALKRFIEIEAITQPLLVVVVGVLGLILNIIGHGGSHGHSHSHESKSHSHKPFIKLKNGGENGNAFNENDHAHDLYVPHNHSNIEHSAGQMNMRGIYLHFLADAIGSVIVIISALVVWLTKWEYRYYMDPILSVISVIIILHTAWPLLRESALILLQTTPTHIQPDDIQERLLNVDGVLAVHGLHVWQLTGDRIVASAHIRYTNLNDYMDSAERVKQFFHDEGIHSITIQPEFVSIENLFEDSLKTKTDTPNRLKTCGGMTIQGRDGPSSVDTPRLWRSRDTISVTIDTMDCSQPFNTLMETQV